jgi:acetyltransferase-like isoleucine patch superfamily enzyme
MEDEPKTISVIVATYNTAKVIEETLDCLAAQTFRSFEAILVDGASTDATVSIARSSLGAPDFIISEPDSGIADAWNKGLRMARGKWIIFLNAGDLLPPDHFQMAMATLNGVETPACLFCNCLQFDDATGKIRRFASKSPDLKKLLRGAVGFAHAGSFMSRDVFEQIGAFDTNLKIAIDTDLIIRAFLLIDGMKFVKFESTSYFQAGGVSEREIFRASREYFTTLVSQNQISPNGARVRALLVYFARIGFRALRYLSWSARWLKHLVLAFTITAIDFIPLHWVRSIIFRLLGYRLGRQTSIGMGFRFYRPGNIALGRGSVVNRNCVFDNRASITIGENVSISRGVKIFTSGHNIRSPFFEMISRPVTIEDRASLFSECIILPGVTIGEGAIVHAGAVVSKDVEPFCIVAGNPARKVGQRPRTLKYRFHYNFPMAQ